MIRPKLFFTLAALLLFSLAFLMDNKVFWNSERSFRQRLLQRVPKTVVLKHDNEVNKAMAYGSFLDDPSFLSTLKFAKNIIPLSKSSTTLKGVQVDDAKKFVFKSAGVSDFSKFDPLEREICVFSHLAKFSWAPKLVWYNSSALITSYVGEPLTVFNIPLNYREQYENILVDMESVGVEHGDIYKKCHMANPALCRRPPHDENYELMVQQVNDTPHISLVDFGWAKVHGSFACQPKGNLRVVSAIPQTTKNEAPGALIFKKDRSVLQKLDGTFQRHLQLEQHFLVDWTMHYTEKQIRTAIKSWPNLLIRKMVQHPKITNDEERVSILSKFYNQHINDFRGTTPFNMYFIYDLEPKYDMRPSSKGQRLVNTAMFDLKKELRTKMGGGFFIHATDNIQETKENQVALRQPDEYQKRKFQSLREVFNVLNFSGIDYVVLRNFEKMPDNVNVDPSHLDVDLLVSDYYEAKRILDGDSPDYTWSTSYENGKYRIVNRVIIEGKPVDFDLRHVGDNYLYKQWQLDILNRRVKLDTGIFVPSEEDHLYSIIYHAIIQKPKISETYVNVMKSLGNFTDAQARDKKLLREKLDSFMDNHGYKFVAPLDTTVGYFSS